MCCGKHLNALMEAIRIGLIVLSSNTTTETEIPAMLFARAQLFPERFSFHSSRMRMKQVTQDELKRMDDDAGRCVLELSDARPSVFAYACLVARCKGSSYHRKSEYRLNLAVGRLNPDSLVDHAESVSTQGVDAPSAQCLCSDAIFVCNSNGSRSRRYPSPVGVGGYLVADTSNSRSYTDGA